MLSLFPGVIVDEQFAASFCHSVGVLWHDLVGITCKNHQKCVPWPMEIYLWSWLVMAGPKILLSADIPPEPTGIPAST